MRRLIFSLILVAGCAQNPSAPPRPKPPAPPSWAVAIYVDVTTWAAPGRLPFMDALENAIVDNQCLGDDGMLAIARTHHYARTPFSYASSGFEGRARRRRDVTGTLRDFAQSWYNPDEQNMAAPEDHWVRKSEEGGQLSGISRLEEFLGQPRYRARRRVLIVWGDPKLDSLGLPAREERLLSPREWRRRRRAEPPETHVYGLSRDLHNHLKQVWKDTPGYCFHPPGDPFVAAHSGWKAQR